MTIAEHPSTSPQRAASQPARPGTRFRRLTALSALGVAAVTLAACGSSSSASTTSPSTTVPAAGGSGAVRQFPGTSGTIAAINGASLEVQNATTGQTTVSYTSTTTFDQTVTTTAAAVTVGSCVSAFGKPTSASSSSRSAFGGPVTATSVSITQPTSGSCTGGFGRGFGGAGGGAGAGRPPGGGEFSGGNGFRPPSGGAGAQRRFTGRFGAASGSVTAVDGSELTVSETGPSTKKTTSVVVTLTSTTTFTERQPAAASDLAVGKCANAVGSADSTGAVTARSITISTPVANGCTAGFGRFGGFRGGAGAAGSAGGAGGPTSGSAGGA